VKGMGEDERRRRWGWVLTLSSEPGFIPPPRTPRTQVQPSACGAEHRFLASIPAMPNLVSEAVNP